ncbi:aminotransferase class I/II-fold pyridoxal phosphate-dependent enzyme, partial [candidate division KSB1 bacterium]|nr:aminotransferase class I/II-fold pyridoxal phosphate-dependent enzyme [candidate division KSB1 bacterium]
CQKERPRLIVICSPNNPTGGEIDPEYVRRLCWETPGLVFWDEAYAEFSDQNALSLLPECENLIVSRTFSKACSMAGLRLGYLVAHPRLIEELYKVYLPYSINVFTETVALTLLDTLGWISQNVSYLVQEREWLFKQLQSIPQIRVYPSRANFFLLKVPGAEKAIQYLQDRSITVRNIGSGSKMLHDHFRVSVSTHEENRLFIDSLQSYVQAYVPSE